MRLVVVAILFSSVMPLQAAEPVLFPNPLHVAREVRDSVSQSVQRIDEYCEANRVVAVSGDRTVVTDYRAGTVTRIDRRAGTYSVAPFASTDRSTSAKASRSWTMRPVAPQTIASRAADVVEIDNAAAEGLRRIRIASTADVTLSRAAAEILLGVAYPAPRSDAAEAVLKSMRIEMPSGSSTAATYRFPLETTMTWDVAGETVDSYNRVVELSFMRPPAEVTNIPAGSRRVEPPTDPGVALLELESASR